MINICLRWIKVPIPIFLIIFLTVAIGALFGISIGYALKNLKHQPIQIISINEEAIFREKSLKLAKLNLNATELKNALSEFKKAFNTLLKELPSNYVIFHSNALLRRDNVLDLTEDFISLLAEPALEMKK